MTWLILQIQFLTRIPIPIEVDFDEKKFARSIILAPIIGFIIGIIIAGTYYLFSLIGQKAVAVLFVIIAEIIITSGLHLDGLADTFDGIFSNRPREKILEIMRDSRIGTNGTLVIVLTILAKLILIFSIRDDYIYYTLVMMPVISRMNIIWAAGISTYARKDRGMAKSIVDHCGLKEIIISTILGSIICILLFKFILLIAIPMAVLFCIIFVQYTKSKINGITGDVIGAMIELSEVIVLLTIVIIGKTI